MNICQYLQILASICRCTVLCTYVDVINSVVSNFWALVQLYSLLEEWKSLFVEGKPLYEVTDEAVKGADEDVTPGEVLEEERQALLDEGDFMEYKVCFGSPFMQYGMVVTTTLHL